MVEVDEERVAGVVGVESEVDELGDELITGEEEVSWEEEGVVWWHMQMAGLEVVGVIF